MTSAVSESEVNWSLTVQPSLCHWGLEGFFLFCFVLFRFIFMYINVLLVCMSVHKVLAWYPKKSEEVTESPGT